MPTKPLDLPRLHRFLVEHGTELFVAGGDSMVLCVACQREILDAHGHASEAHAPDCEWVALVEMTKP